MPLVVSICESSQFFPHFTHFNPPCLAGSILPPLTMNGRLFEAISLTGGRYGFVHFALVSPGMLWRHGLELIDSFGRFTLSHVWPALSA